MRDEGRERPTQQTAKAKRTAARQLPLMQPGLVDGPTTTLSDQNFASQTPTEQCYVINCAT